MKKSSLSFIIIKIEIIFYLLFILFLFTNQSFANLNSKPSESTNKERQSKKESSRILVKNLEFLNGNNAEISLEIEVLKKADFRFFILTNPDRLVIDINKSDLLQKNYKPVLPPFIKSFRYRVNENSLRLVFDLSQKILLKKTFFEESSSKIIAQISGASSDLTKKKSDSKSQSANLLDSKTANAFDGKTKETDFIFKKAEEFSEEVSKNASSVNEAKKEKKIAKIKRIPIIVIDAGHGGKDPGTIGNFARTKEKNVTLSYAKELAKMLNNSGLYKVYLTRDDDFFIELKSRVQKARRRKADLFISLHANSISDPSVSGFSIYTLSEKSSDKQAELLAQKENQADIINGINLSGASHDIMKTLIDLSQRESKNNSSIFANIVVNAIRNSEIEILQNSHRFAGFAVLTAPDMASVLIELGYLSNKKEEKLLNTVTYKRKVALSLVKAVSEYFTINSSFSKDASKR